MSMIDISKKLSNDKPVIKIARNIKLIIAKILCY